MKRLSKALAHGWSGVAGIKDFMSPAKRRFSLLKSHATRPLIRPTCPYRSVFCGLSMTLLLLLGSTRGWSGEASGDVLIVQDEMPQVRVLTELLKGKGELNVEVVDQAHLPDSLKGYQAVIGFIHGELKEKTELAIIDYTKAGGRYVCLHHSISSGKAENRYYFDFLGIELDNPDQSSQPVKPGGGYGWYHAGEEGVKIAIVNLNPNHYINSHQIEWPERVDYMPSDFPSVSKAYPAVVLRETEAYMNHKFTDGREKRVLCGLKFHDDRNDQLFMQDRAVWTKPQGDGEIVYILPGERPSDYRNDVIGQMVLNAVKWKGIKD